MLTNEQIQARLDELNAGDSNDAEIDGLTEIIRDLQAERAQKLQVSFAGEAYESFQAVAAFIEGYGVTVTTQEGEVIEGVLVGPTRTSEWGDEIAIYPVTNGEYHTLAWYISNEAEARIVRVGDIEVA